MSERCNRCGEDAEDRRTLWMACLYEMGELGVPFEQKPLFKANIEDLEKAKDPGSIDLGNGKTLNITPGTVTCKGELTPMLMYTLRVCKACRAEWMQAIQAWFHFKPMMESCGSGIFVRRNGATVEISREEWDRLNPNREPVVAKP